MEAKSVFCPRCSDVNVNVKVNVARMEAKTNECMQVGRGKTGYVHEVEEKLSYFFFSFHRKSIRLNLRTKSDGPREYRALPTYTMNTGARLT